MSKVLVIDDDRAILELLRAAFRDDHTEVLTAGNVSDGLKLAADAPDVAVLDIHLPDMDGFEAAHRIQTLHPATPVIFITARGTSETAIEAMKRGACDFLLKPLDLQQIRRVVGRAIRIRQSSEAPAAQANGIESAVDQIIGRSPPMQEVFKAVGRVAPQNVSVLILGESGTGKELVARAIHNHGPRIEHPFLAVNCAAIPEALLESELFGHEKGSFTGADDRRIGKFEQCSGGTIFLDEIGDMSPLVQSKVLRLLQEQAFERVGGTDTIRTDVRIIAATNRDLKQMVADGRFREDLYYRLDGFTIRLPPLRERRDDLPLLLEHLLKKLGRELNKPVRGISEDACRWLASYRWPGNVRELEAVVRQALLHATGPILLPEFLPEFIVGETTDARHSSDTPPSDLKPFLEERLRRQSRHVYAESLTMMERFVLWQVLREAQGNQSQAARMLGITRGCLRSRIRELHISLGAKIAQEPSAGRRPTVAAAP